MTLKHSFHETSIFNVEDNYQVANINDSVLSIQKKVDFKWKEKMFV